MEHHFNIKIAKIYGVEGAILLHNINFWIEKNEANNRHFYDGKFWTYSSIEAFTKLFPYWSKRQIERIVNNLIKQGALIKGNYNAIAYDRTAWYALTETVKSIYANGEMELTKQGNGFTQTVSPIPDSNKDNNTDNKIKSESENFSELNFSEVPFDKWTKQQFKDSIQVAREARAEKKDLPKFGRDMLTSFFAYWSEPDIKGRMRFQMQKTWNTAGRLVTWENRDKK